MRVSSIVVATMMAVCLALSVSCSGPGAPEVNYDQAKVQKIRDAVFPPGEEADADAARGSDKNVPADDE